MTPNSTTTPSDPLPTAPTPASGDLATKIKPTTSQAEVTTPEEINSTTSGQATRKQLPQTHGTSQPRVSTSDAAIEAPPAYGRTVADAEDLANQRLNIKETIRRTQDARRPHRLKGSAKKATVSQSDAGADVKRSGLYGSDGGTTTDTKIGLEEGMEQDVHEGAKELESEEGRLGA